MAAAQQFLLVPVFATHLAVYVPAVNPVQLNTALFPDQELKVHWLELALAYASIQSYPEALAGQVTVNAWPIRGLAGFIMGELNPQLLHEADEMLKDMVKSEVFILFEESVHLT